MVLNKEQEHFILVDNSSVVLCQTLTAPQLEMDNFQLRQELMESVVGAANIFGRHNKNYKISLNSKRFFDRMSKDWRGVRIFNFGKSRDSFKKYALLNKYYDGELPFDSPLDLSKYLNSYCNEQESEISILAKIETEDTGISPNLPENRIGQITSVDENQTAIIAQSDLGIGLPRQGILSVEDVDILKNRPCKIR